MEEGFRRLLKFVEDNGHARVLDDHEVDGYKLGKKAGDPEIEGFKLGVWVTTQRRLFKKNGSLEGDREARLSAVEGWVWDARDAKWEESFRQLEDFVKVHGHARVPKSGDYGKLGTWVQLQRTAYKNDKLGPDREQRLLKVGWVPKTDWHNEQWENGFDHLLKYVADKGDACVPPTYKDADDDYPLGKWAQHQRSSQKNGKLNADREERLGELKGWGWATK